MKKNSKVFVAVVAVLCAVGIGVWVWQLQRVPQPKPLPVAEATKPVEPPRPAVDIDEGEALFKQLMGEKLAPYAGEESLLRRLVAATEQIASGESPRTLLGFLQPKGTYEAVRKKKKLYPDSKSYQRYDAVTSALTSIDPRNAADVYAKVKPYTDAIYEEIGRPGTTFDGTLRKAISNLTAAPVPDGEPELTDDGALYQYADPKLEGLNAAQKHLLRMGPKNQVTLQDWLKKLEGALPPNS